MVTKKGKIINGKYFCYCGRLMREISKDLEGKKVYQCFINNHILNEKEFA